MADPIRVTVSQALTSDSADSLEMLRDVLTPKLRELVGVRGVSFSSPVSARVSQLLLEGEQALEALVDLEMTPQVEAWIRAYDKADDTISLSLPHDAGLGLIKYVEEQVWEWVWTLPGDFSVSGGTAALVDRANPDQLEVPTSFADPAVTTAPAAVRGEGVSGQLP